ncbi:uncharacterized protein LOC131957905 [Physella acuta]|uniref:uncharacterized protein LOC131957905 n=1 Tax=Physella acuta TaxID=109671 RepID=UPI0027DE04B0|nr:uncharacterized protein LOC131957905 [Physella acuta]XP_059178717.1 uncharacterized protein LOC131957905 [Physella acuta]XP_059178718.1 uncharacterized protein LOC131957905 [Physella acuta]
MSRFQLFLRRLNIRVCLIVVVCGVVAIFLLMPKIASWALTTMDIPDTQQRQLRNLRDRGHVTNLAALDLSLMTDEELLLTVHSYPDNTNTICERKLRMGNLEDGGWEICDDKDVRPTPPCTIYSFGINYDFSFDDDAARYYGCHVFSFDPSMGIAPDRFNRSSHIHFYKLGISHQNVIDSKGWELKTFSALKQLLGHRDNLIQVVKMDIEQAEWKTIEEMSQSGQLATIGQFLVEFHVVSDSRDYLLPRLKVMQILERAGFKKFYVHKNTYCGTLVRGFPATRTECYEVHYVRR